MMQNESSHFWRSYYGLIGSLGQLTQNILIAETLREVSPVTDFFFIWLSL